MLARAPIPLSLTNSFLLIIHKLPETCCGPIFCILLQFFFWYSLPSHQLRLHQFIHLKQGSEGAKRFTNRRYMPLLLVHMSIFISIFLPFICLSICLFLYKYTGFIFICSPLHLAFAFALFALEYVTTDIRRIHVSAYI